MLTPPRFHRRSSSDVPKSAEPIVVMLPDGSVRLYATDSDSDIVTARRVLGPFPDHDVFATTSAGSFEPLSPKRVLKPGGTYQIVPRDVAHPAEDLLPTHIKDLFSSHSKSSPVDLDAICSGTTGIDGRRVQPGCCDLRTTPSTTTFRDRPTKCRSAAELTTLIPLRQGGDDTAGENELRGNIFGSSRYSCSVLLAHPVYPTATCPRPGTSDGTRGNAVCSYGNGFRRSHSRKNSISEDLLKAAQLQQLAGQAR
ncbi:hypothetical protein CLOM_g12677 [Closterium sp. NIES-68]|nr:hypothetical protein CLOM_g12677 [Closterium sp. NIES-68]GJP82779.1 hypothetical protein CLOP_g13013 [Closterium sp. NIES-67]